MKRKWDIFTILAVLFGLALAQGCKPQSSTAGGMPQMPPPLVTTVAATSADVPVYLDEIGKCSALESVTIKPQVAGRIIERHFEDGQELKKGQLLFTIDPRPFKAALDSAKAQLAQANAQVNLAHIQLEMWSSVADTRAVSKSDFDTKKNAVDVAKAQVEAAQAAVENAQINLDYCEIKSPIDGRTGQRLVDAGNIVEANTTSLLLIQRLDHVYADFTVTERELSKVQQEMSRGTLKTLVRLPEDVPRDGRPGELTFLDNQVQDGTGTVKLRTTVPNQDHHFWPGQFANIRLILTIQKNAVLVPNQATQISQQGPYVYVVKPDNTAELRVVELGQRQGDDIVISKGVRAGEQVVLVGQMAVQPGGPVRVDNGSAEPLRAAEMQSGPTTREGSKS